MSKFSEITIGSIFKAGGMSYRKVDSLTYEDPANRIQTQWDPLFESTIETDAVPEASGDKFKVDPQTRTLVPNPGYKPPEEWLDELYITGLFDCDPKDYEAIVKQCIKWGTAAKSKGKGKKKR